MKNTILKLNVQIDLDLISREVPTERIVELTVHAPDHKNNPNRQNLNLALVIDRSGSMAGDKLEFAKQAACHVLDLLQEKDRVSLVAYETDVELLSPSVLMTNENRILLSNIVKHLRNGATTNLSGGWLVGCQEVAANISDNSLNRTFLLTDGLANVGIRDLEELARHARELYNRGVSTSTFGIGEDYDEHLLEAMSNQGGGNFYYIGSPAQIPEFIIRELKEVSAVTARDVELTLELPFHVDIKVLGDWRVDRDQNRIHVILGNLYSGRQLPVYIKLITPPSDELTHLNVPIKLYGKGEEGQIYEDQKEITLRYADRQEVEASPRRVDLLRRFAPIDLAEAANESLKLDRLGRREEAIRIMEISLQTNAAYIDHSLVEKYWHQSERMKYGMDEMERKVSHYDAYTIKKSRQR